MFAALVLLNRFRRYQQLIKGGRGLGRFVREVAPHGAEGYENFIYVPPIVAGILFLLQHHANHDIGEVVEINILPHRIAPREQLFRSIAAEKRDAATLARVFPVVKSTLPNADAANLL